MNESSPLHGRTVLVTGGSRGIGEAIVFAFARQGCRVTFCYRADHDAASSVCKRAEVEGLDVQSAQLDVTDSQATAGLVAALESRSGQVDVLVNNVGRFPRRAATEISDAEWDSVLRVNLSSVFYASRAVLPAMIAAQDGAIINIASVAGQRGSAFHAHYAAAKGGVIALTQSLAREVARYNVRVNAVSPGRIVTDLLMEHGSAAEQERWLRETPAARLGTPEEVAAAVLFLALPTSAYITGETISVNGGLFID